MLVEITVIDEPWQRLETYLSGQPVALELMWNATSERWALSLAIAGTTVLQGLRLVPGHDLLAAYEFNIGRLFLVDWLGKGGEPDRAALPAGVFRLIHDDGLADA